MLANNSHVMRIVTIVGARPQFVKAAIVSKALQKREGMEEILLHTGQHYDDSMSAIFFRQLGIRDPAINLGVGSGPHGYQTGQMLAGIETSLIETRPDLVLVYGDTNSTLAGALAAAKLQIPIAHVEAGLRSFNFTMPEEINRVVADRLSELLFTPGEVANANLLAEGIPPERIWQVGDVMFDATLLARSQLTLNERPPSPYILLTIHRAENTDDERRLAVIVDAVNEIAREIRVVFPVHPRTRNRLHDSGLSLNERVECCAPMGYFEMMAAEAQASCVVTDSGGVQKEAFFHRVPCVTVRDETEWTELVDCGWNTVSPPRDVRSVVDSIRNALHERPTSAPPLYGDGCAGERIADRLVAHGANRPALSFVSLPPVTLRE